MKKTKIWLIIATLLLVIGIIIFGVVMMKFKWDFGKLQTTKYETNDYEISESYKNISIKGDTADILFVPSTDNISKIVCYEQKNAKHTVKVNEDTLVIELVDNRKWYEHIGISFDTQKITVYIPKGEYGELYIKESTGDVEIPKEFKFENIDIALSTGDVKCMASAVGKIKTHASTGDIYIDNVSADMLDLAVSTGKIDANSVNCATDFKVKVSTGDASLTDISCKNLYSNGSTGDIYLKNVICEQTLSAKRSTGDISFEKCDAAEILTKTSTGSVKGSLLSSKVFIAETDTGSVKVPKTTEGGKCEITTDTGNINIIIEQ